MKTAYIVGSIILIIVIIIVTWGFSSNWETVNSNNKNLHQNNKNLRNDLDLVKQQVLQLKKQNNKLDIQLKNKQKLTDNIPKSKSKIKVIRPGPTDDNCPTPSSSSGSTGSNGESSNIVDGLKGEAFENTPQEDSNSFTDTNVIQDQKIKGVGYSSS